MRDGLYSLEYRGADGFGLGMLIFESGQIFGADTGLGKYDGSFVINPDGGMADITLVVEIPANRPSVLGPAQLVNWNIDVTVTADPSKDSEELVASTNFGEAFVRYQFLRELPPR